MITVVDKGQPVTVVAFSGLAPKNCMFEWVKTFRLMNCNFVGVRDPESDWYQTRKIEIAWDVADAPPPGVKRLFIGASAGGFAALLFGKMMKADAIIAISPQSACGQAKRDLGDLRWPQFCDHTPSCDISGEHNAIVHYATDDEHDTMHAGRLICRQTAYPSGGHNLAGKLKDDGLIGDIIAAELERIAA